MTEGRGQGKGSGKWMAWILEAAMDDEPGFWDMGTSPILGTHFLSSSSALMLPQRIAPEL